MAITEVPISVSVIYLNLSISFDRIMTASSIYHKEELYDSLHF